MLWCADEEERTEGRKEGQIVMGAPLSFANIEAVSLLRCVLAAPPRSTGLFCVEESLLLNEEERERERISGSRFFPPPTMTR